MTAVIQRQGMQVKAIDVHCKSCQKSINHSKDFNLDLYDFKTKLPQTGISIGDRLTF